MCRIPTPEGNEIMEKEPREQTTLHLPVELKEKLQEEATRKGCPLKDLMIMILEDYLQTISQE